MLAIAYSGAVRVFRYVPQGFVVILAKQDVNQLRIALEPDRFQYSGLIRGRRRNVRSQ